MSTRKLDPCNAAETNRISHGLSTNTGGGSAGSGLERDFRVLSLSSSILSFLGAICFIYGHSLAFESPVEKCLILGGMK